MLSCCAAELDPQRRVVTAEEVFEADVPLANVASMQTRPACLDREEVDLRRLVAGFLRMAPDVAIVGEVRDREALPRKPLPRLVRSKGGRGSRINLAHVRDVRSVSTTAGLSAKRWRGTQTSSTNSAGCQLDVTTSVIFATWRSRPVQPTDPTVSSAPYVPGLA
jgi:hypothetical protein